MPLIRSLRTYKKKKDYQKQTVLTAIYIDFIIARQKKKRYYER